jgi:hypothetical protein
VEWSNEVWNFQFAQTAFAREGGDALDLGSIDHDGDPGTPEVEDLTVGLVRFYARRARQVHAIFTAVFGGTGRLVRVLASQAVVPFFTRTILEFENAAAGVDAFAIAPYFGDAASTGDQVEAYRTLGVDGIFDWLRGARPEPRLELNLARVDQVVADQLEVVASFGLPLITYEGGQHLVGAAGFENDEALNAIFDAVNRDPRMHGVYTAYLESWRRRGPGVFWHFAHVDRWSRFGRWGSLEYQTQPRGSAPKFDALHDFIEAAAGGSFSDVPPGHPLAPWIAALARAGITGGCASSPPAFCPEGPVTRAQMAVFVLRGLHGAGYTPPPPSGLLADVPAGSPFAAWIERFLADGLTSGCGVDPPRYCPDQPVSRGEAAVFLLRAKHGAGYRPPDATGLFTDVAPEHPFAAWIEALAAEGITAGCASQPPRFCPARPITRGEMAVYLVRTFGLPL